MKNLKMLLALVLISTTLMTACGGKQTPPPDSPSKGIESTNSAANGKEKVVTIGQSSEVSNLNPTLQPRTPDSNVQCLIFDYLVIPNEDLSYTGDLAKSWDISEDGKTYTFHLQEGVTWHDGVPFTAKDVVFTLTALADPTYVGGAENRVMSIAGAQEYQAGAADSIVGITAPDDNTVVIQLIEENAAFLGNMYVCILPEHILKAVSPGTWEQDSFNRAPIGTGRYKFVTWASSQYIELEKNADYFGTQPSIDRVYVRFGDETTLAAALINGEIDVLYNMSVSELEVIEASNDVSAFTYEMLSMSYIGLNQLNEHLSDLKVRQALTYGIDKAKIVSTVFGEVAVVSDDIFPNNHWSHSDNVTTYKYDPAKAKELLVEAGYTMNNSTGYFEKDGKTLHLTYDMVTSTDAASVAQLIQQYWKAIGVEMEIIEQDFSTLAFSKLFPSDNNGSPRYVTADDFTCYTLGFGVEADPDEYRDYFTTISKVGSWNFINYSNEKVDELFVKSMKLTNPKEREACFHEIGEIISEDLPWIPLYSKNTIAGVSNKVENFTADFRGITFQIEKWSMND